MSSKTAIIILSCLVVLLCCCSGAALTGLAYYFFNSNTTIDNCLYVTPTPTPTPDESCVVGGCSGQLCLGISSESMMSDNTESSSSGVSTCEWTDSYSCLTSAICEVQKNTGKCGWTYTAEYYQCVENLPVITY